MIMIMAGTSDGRKLAEILSEKLKGREEIVVTAASDYGAHLASEASGLNVVCGAMDQQQLVAFIKDRGVTLLVDATHPYAKVASENAIEAARQTELPYMRYERPFGNMEGAIVFETFEETADYLAQQQGNVLLTIGSNHLSTFTSRVPLERLTARILPTMEALKKTLETGLTPGQIIAAQGPFSKAFNKALINDRQIEFVVTKDSSDIGGMEEKVAATKEMGAVLVVVGRPKVAYGCMYHSMDALVEAVMTSYKVPN